MRGVPVLIINARLSDRTFKEFKVPKLPGKLLLPKGGRNFDLPRKDRHRDGRNRCGKGAYRNSGQP